MKISKILKVYERLLEMEVNRKRCQRKYINNINKISCTDEECCWPNNHVDEEKVFKRELLLSLKKTKENRVIKIT